MRGLRTRTTGEPSARIVAAESDALRVQVDTRRLRVALRCGDVALDLAPTAAGVDLDALLRDPRVPRSFGTGELKARAGQALRITCQAGAPGAVGVRLAVEISAGVPGVALCVAIENRGATALVPGDLGVRAAGRGAIAFPRVTRAFGLHASDPQRVALPLAAASPDAAASSRRLRDELLVLGRARGPALLAGFTTAERAEPRVEALLRDGALSRLRLASDTGSRQIAPGEILESERAFLAVGLEAADLLAAWARRCGAEMDARAPGRAVSGWTSRRAPGARRAPADTLRRLLELVRSLSGASVVELEAGLVPPPASWLEPDPAADARLREAIERIEAAGLRPGLALAPLLASGSSRFLASHPDAALRSPGGRRVVARAGRAGRARVVLDPGHAAVPGALRDAFARLRELGIGHFALEGLEPALRAGVALDTERSRVETYRAALGEIRAGAGESARLLGVRAPLGASVGLLDGMRFGSEVPARWRAAPLDAARRLARGPDGDARAGAAHSAASVLSRAFCAQRLFLLDPGAVRAGGAALTDAELKTLLSLFGLGAGAVFSAGDLGGLDARRRGWLQRALPPLARETHAPLPWQRGARPLLVTPLLGARLAVVVVNPSERPAPIRVSLAQLGRSGPHHVFELWEDRYLGVVDREVPPRRVAAHGSRVLALTPVADRPQVVGSTLHVGMGTLEVAALRAERGGGHRLVLRLPGAHAGRVFIAAARARRARPISVSFEDAATLHVPA